MSVLAIERRKITPRHTRCVQALDFAGDPFGFFFGPAKFGDPNPFTFRILGFERCEWNVLRIVALRCNRSGHAKDSLRRAIVPA